MTMTNVASGTVVEPLTVTDLAAESSHVVRAHIIARYVLPERGPRGEIYTRIELDVHEYILGMGPAEITIQQLGGQLGELTMVLSGNATLEPGQEMVLFLDHSPEHELYYIVGLAQGAFTIDRSGPMPTVDRDLSGLAFYLAEPVHLGHRVHQETLDQLLTIFELDLDEGQSGLEGGVK
jgi:hypothetical protein